MIAIILWRKWPWQIIFTETKSCFWHHEVCVGRHNIATTNNISSTVIRNALSLNLLYNVLIWMHETKTNTQQQQAPPANTHTHTHTDKHTLGPTQCDSVPPTADGAFVGAIGAVHLAVADLIGREAHQSVVGARVLGRLTDGRLAGLLVWAVLAVNIAVTHPALGDALACDVGIERDDIDLHERGCVGDTQRLRSLMQYSV